MAFVARPSRPRRYDGLMRTLPAFVAALLLVAPASLVPAEPDVELARVPDGGIQPEIVVDAARVAHMVYLAGQPGAANVFYVRSSDGGRTFSPAVRVNSQAGSAIAMGTIRGAQIAVGRNGRVHIAWNGSSTAEPRPPAVPGTAGAGVPMLYARSNAAGTAFEPQRNLMTRTTHLDGGGSIAADRDGHVYVAWHGNGADGQGGEDQRRVWLAVSTDDGATFAGERAVSNASSGVCGCCALRMATTAGGELQLLYRAATGKVHRDVHALSSRDRGRSFESARVHPWNINACPMTSMSMSEGRVMLRAWETDGQVYFDAAGSADSPKAPPASGTGDAKRRKHPRLAVGADGTVLLAWAEGTSGGRGGAVAWQMFGPDGRPNTVAGTRPALPAWSFPAVLARPDGRFTILLLTSTRLRGLAPHRSRGQASRSTMTFMTGPPPSACCMPCWSSSSAMTRLSSGATSTAPVDTRPIASSQAARV